jgi:hypothetical protein
MIDEDDLAAGGAHPLELAHDPLGHWHHGHDVHGYDGVEALVGKGESARIHLVQPGDVGEIMPVDLVLSLSQHLGRKIDAGDGEMAAIARE